MLKAAISIKALAIVVALFGLQFVCFCCSWPLYAHNVVSPQVTPKVFTGAEIGRPYFYPEWQGTLLEAPKPYYFGIVWRIDCSVSARQGQNAPGWLDRLICSTDGISGAVVPGGEITGLPFLLLVAAGIIAVVVGWRLFWKRLRRHQRGPVPFRAKGPSGAKKLPPGAARRLHLDSQGKHIVGHRNFQPIRNGEWAGRFTHKDPQGLLNAFEGKGQPANLTRRGYTGFKERVDFGDVIGEYFDKVKNQWVETSKGIIHYGKNGAHIIPREP